MGLRLNSWICGLMVTKVGFELHNQSLNPILCQITDEIIYMMILYDEIITKKVVQIFLVISFASQCHQNCIYYYFHSYVKNLNLICEGPKR